MNKINTIVERLKVIQKELEDIDIVNNNYIINEIK